MTDEIYFTLHILYIYISFIKAKVNIKVFPASPDKTSFFLCPCYRFLGLLSEISCRHAATLLSSTHTQKRTCREYWDCVLFSCFVGPQVTVAPLINHWSHPGSVPPTPAVIIQSQLDGASEAVDSIRVGLKAERVCKCFCVYGQWITFWTTCTWLFETQWKRSKLC